MRNVTKTTLAAHRRKLLRGSQKTSTVRGKNKRVLKIKKRKHSTTPTYLSSTYTEYKIYTNDVGLYQIRRHGGGKVPAKIAGQYSSFSQAEKDLINYLEETDKTRQSRYPGCPERKENAYTELYLQNVNKTSTVADKEY